VADTREACADHSLAEVPKIPHSIASIIFVDVSSKTEIQIIYAYNSKVHFDGCHTKHRTAHRTEIHAWVLTKFSE